MPREVAMRSLSMSEAIRETLATILRKHDEAFLIGEDIGVYGGAFKITQGFVDEFGPKRVIDTPIAEGGFVSMACGAALMGSRPIIEIMFMDFLTLAMDGIINSAVKWQEIYGDDFRMPIIVRCPAGAGRSYGPTHSQSFEGMLMNIPGLTICCPSTPADAAGMLLGAYEAAKPTIFVEHKELYARKDDVPDSPSAVLPGIGRCVQRGHDISLITYGRQLGPTMKAAQELETSGCSVDVIDLRTIKPLDRKLVVESISRTGKGICIEESPVIGGVGAEISAVIMQDAFEFLEAPIQRLGAAEQAIPCCPELERACFPTTQDIVTTATKLLDY